MNQRSCNAYLADTLYLFFFSSLETNNRACLLNLASDWGGNVSYPFIMLDMVSAWDSDSKGVMPVINLKTVMPSAHTSTSSS